MHDRPMTSRETLLIRYINDSVMALRELSLSAADGSTASEKILKDVADKLIKATGDTRRAREARVPAKENPPKQG